MPFLDVYKNRKVLVTGHSGFEGSWLCFWLHKLGAQVTGFGLPPHTSPNLFSALDLAAEVFHYTGDIRSVPALHEAVEAAQPEIIFHLAAQPRERVSFKDPRATFETNVMGTVNLLEAVRSLPNVRAVVIVTTDRCYDDREWSYGYRESDPLGGFDPYSSSKACAELVSAAYRHSFFNPVDHGMGHRVGIATARAGSVIGGGDWSEDRLIPDCVRAFSAGKMLVLRYPTAIRPWQHVLEPLSGYLWLAALLHERGPGYADAWNFGPDDRSLMSVETIVKSIAAQWGNAAYRLDDDVSPPVAEALKLDISRAHRELDWHPGYTVEEAVKQTVAWYQAYYGGKRADIVPLSHGQIDAYVSAAGSARSAWCRDE